MIYDGVFNITPAASSSAYNTFRGNSIFDPDFTGVGSTASGYSNMAAVYGRYRVISAKVSVVFNATSANGSMGFIIATPQNTVGTSFTAIMAQKFSWCKQLGNTNGPQLNHSVSFSTAQIYGTTPAAVMAEDDFAGLIGANPNNAVFVHIGVTNATALAVVTYVQVRIVYVVEWSLPLMTA